MPSVGVLRTFFLSWDTIFRQEVRLEQSRGGSSERWVNALRASKHVGFQSKRLVKQPVHHSLCSGQGHQRGKTHWTRYSTLFNTVFLEIPGIAVEIARGAADSRVRYTLFSLIGGGDHVASVKRAQTHGVVASPTLGPHVQVGSTHERRHSDATFRDWVEEPKSDQRGNLGWYQPSPVPSAVADPPLKLTRAPLLHIHQRSASCSQYYTLHMSLADFP
jgi:hypothetical protein